MARQGGRDGRDAGAQPGRLPRRRGTYPGWFLRFPPPPRACRITGDGDSVSGLSCKSIITNSQTCRSTYDANTCKARWRRRPIVSLAPLPRLFILQSRRMIQSDTEGTVDRDARVAHSVGITTALFLLSPPRAAAPDRPGTKPHKPRKLRHLPKSLLRLARFNWVAVGPTDRSSRGLCRGAERCWRVSSTVQALEFVARATRWRRRGASCHRRDSAVSTYPHHPLQN